MNFEPADPPLLDPYILEQFSEDEIRKEDQNMRHKYVLKKLADFIPTKHKHKNQASSKSAFSPNVKVTHSSSVSDSCAPCQGLPLKIISATSILRSDIYRPLITNPPHSTTSILRSDISRPLISNPPHSTSHGAISPPSLPKPEPELPGLQIQQQQQQLPCSSPTLLNSSGVTVGNPLIKPRATKRFTYFQSVVLEEFFQKYGSARIVDRVALAQQLGLYKNDVIGWFQSRRRKERRALSLNDTTTEQINGQIGALNSAGLSAANHISICASGVR